MFCIAAFIVFGVLALFSASYRPLAKSAWHCVLRRVTLRPCDINFSDEVKGRLIGRYAVSRPRLAKFLHHWVDWMAFVFVALSIWSTVYVLNAGLNLWVYDTCDPTNVESCSLGGEACGVNKATLGFVGAVREGALVEWATGPFTRFAEAVSRIPDRLKTWEPEPYLGPTTTYLRPFDEAKPTALEVIDPLCQFCRKLWDNIHDAGFQDTHNVAALLYPIPDEASATGYKFGKSGMIAGYIEATKLVPLPGKPTTPDWLLIEKIFGIRPDGEPWQEYFKIGSTDAEAKEKLRTFLADIGYSAAQIQRIETLAASPEVAESLRAQKQIVEDQLRTIKIPTILFGGRRYDRVVDAETLREAGVIE